MDIENFLLAELAPQFGFPTTGASYFAGFRNPVLSFFSGERLAIIYSNEGIAGVKQEVQKLRDEGII